MSEVPLYTRYMHYTGVGVSKNVTMGEMYYTKALIFLFFFITLKPRVE